jgi:tripartite tricarboxylate transporter family receptor
MECDTKRKYKSFRLDSEKFCNFSCLREEVQFPLDHTIIGFATGAIALPACFDPVRADDYPSRPITIVVPFPAGGPTDTLARILADRMTAFLGQSVIIENISGAGGSVGLGRVVHAAPDGYTLPRLPRPLAADVSATFHSTENGECYACEYH